MYQTQTMDTMARESVEICTFTPPPPNLMEQDHNLDSGAFGRGPIIHQAIWNVYGIVWMHQVIPYPEHPACTILFCSGTCRNSRHIKLCILKE